jgi:repressor of nif and glnA expression
MDRHSLSGLLALGRPGQPLLNIPVATDRVGVVMAAGLNPVAAIHENGPMVGFQPMAGVVDYRRFRSFQEWRDRFSG